MHKKRNPDKKKEAVNPRHIAIKQKPRLTGRTASMSVEIDLATGSVTEIGQAFSQAQTLSEQLALENLKLSTASNTLIQSLVS